MPHLLAIGEAPHTPAFSTSVVVDIPSALEIARTRTVDCLLVGPCDHALALSALDELRANAILRELPVVILLREGAEAQAEALLHAGAADWVLAGESARNIERALLLAVANRAHATATATADDCRQSLSVLTSRQRQLETVIQHVPAYVYVLDLDGRYALVNRAYEDLVGIPFGELEGKSVFDVFAAGEATRFVDNNRLVAESGAPHEFEEAARVAGEDRLYASIKAPLRAEDGTSAIIGVSWDVTEQRRAARALAESEMRLRLALDTAGMGTVAHLLAENVLQLDDVARQLFGVEEERVEFATFLTLLHPDDQQQVAEIVQSSLAQPATTPSGLEFRIVRGDRGMRWISARFVVLLEGEGDSRVPSYILATVQDVTERRDHENALQMALAAKDAFLGMVSHELRTPLTMIAANAELLGRTRDPASEMADEISANAHRLSRVIDNMLAIARAEQRKGPEPEPALVIRLVEGIVARHRRTHPDRTITVAGDTEVLPVLCVPDYLDLILSNLLSNAERHGQGPVTVEFRGLADRVEVHVLDDGPGIDSSRAAGLFEPFFEVEREDPSAGLGLGLSVSKGLVELLNGTIWVTARPEGGSDFAFSLPVATAETDAG